MRSRPTPTTYGRLTQALHWVSTVLIVALFPLGMVMVRLADGALKTTLYGVHIAAGLLLAALTLIRLVGRFVEPAPATPGGMSRPRRIAFHGVHVLLYLVLVPLTASGVAMLLASGLSLWPPAVVPSAILHDLGPRVGHDIGSKVYMVIVVVHIAGALLYQRFKGDVLRRIGVALGGAQG
ncbi:MAG: hypothetical protein HGA45_18795 [Chloroflexales bacterium]|nr:hypothetical protein [Chloroflexales bacterium]